MAHGNMYIMFINIWIRKSREKYTDFAKKIIGISDWKTVIKEIKEKVILRGDGSIE